MSRPASLYAVVVALVVTAGTVGVTIKYRAHAREYLVQRLLGISRMPSPENVRLRDDEELAAREEASVQAAMMLRYGGPLTVDRFMNARQECSAPQFDLFGVVCKQEREAEVGETAGPPQTEVEERLPQHAVTFAARQPTGDVSVDIRVENTEGIDRVDLVAADSDPPRVIGTHSVPAAADFCYSSTASVLKGPFYFTLHRPESDRDYWAPESSWTGDKTHGVLRLNAPFVHDFNNLDGIGYYQPIGGIVLGYWQRNFAPSAMAAVLASVFPYRDEFLPGDPAKGLGFQGPNLFSGGSPDMRYGSFRIRLRGKELDTAGQDLMLFLARSSPSIYNTLDKSVYNYAYVGYGQRVISGKALESGEWVEAEVPFRARKETWDVLLGWRERAERMHKGVDFYRFYEPIDRFLQDVNLNLGLAFAYGDKEDVSVSGTLEIDGFSLCLPNKSLLANGASTRLVRAPKSSWTPAERVTDGNVGDEAPAYFDSFDKDNSFEFAFDEPTRIGLLQVSQTYVFPVRRLSVWIKETEGDWRLHRQIQLPRPRPGSPGNLTTITRQIDTPPVTGLRVRIEEGYNDTIYGLVELAAFSEDFRPARRVPNFYLSDDIKGTIIGSVPLRLVYHPVDGRPPISEALDTAAISEHLGRAYEIVEVESVSGGTRVLARVDFDNATQWHWVRAVAAGGTVSQWLNTREVRGSKHMGFFIPGTTSTDPEGVRLQFRQTAPSDS